MPIRVRGLIILKKKENYGKNGGDWLRIFGLIEAKIEKTGVGFPPSPVSISFGIMQYLKNNFSVGVGKYCSLLNFISSVKNPIATYQLS
jgi:hypothetical protein